MKKIMMILMLFLVACSKQYDDTIQYQKQTYVFLKEPQDSFTYYFNVGSYEEDEITMINHDKWNAINCGGDVYIKQDQYEQAQKYYLDEQNYNYYLVIDDEITIDIAFSNEERKELNDLYKQEANHTIVFDDIDMFVDVYKVSKDDGFKGSINLVLCDGTLYYKTEVMSDDDREYVIELSKHLNQKIQESLK